MMVYVPNFELQNLSDTICFLKFSAVRTGKLMCDVCTNELHHDKTNQKTVRPVKTQISLGICVFAGRTVILMVFHAAAQMITATNFVSRPWSMEISCFWNTFPQKRLERCSTMARILCSYFLAFKSWIPIASYNTKFLVSMKMHWSLWETNFVELLIQCKWV